MDTIFALSSGSPPAAIAVMRISGPDAFAAATRIAGALPAPRRAALRRLRDREGGTLDHALCLCFPGPGSATGEDLVELHLHGGVAVTAAVQRALAGEDGLRLAEPGEFTRRALTNGRIDLAQAHGLADLLAAETEQQRRLALAASEGVLSAKIRGWLASLAAVAAQVEAMIDFDGEDDVDVVSINQIREAIGAILAPLRALLARPSVERLRDGVRVAFAGAPNSGKSSLFNAMLEREAAIVTPIAGTTRDVVEARVIRDGRIFTLIDTAGLRPPHEADFVERIGIERAMAEHRSADLVIALDDGMCGGNILKVRPKADLLPDDERKDGLAVSAAEPATVNILWEMVVAATRYVMPPDGVALDRSQRAAVADAALSLERDSESDDLLIIAEGLRSASRRLGEVIGLNATEMMLDALFTRFCLGK